MHSLTYNICQPLPCVCRHCRPRTRTLTDTGKHFVHMLTHHAPVTYRYILPPPPSLLTSPLQPYGPVHASSASALPASPTPHHAHPLPSLTWAAVLQNYGQEKVLGEHGAHSQAPLPAPSLLTAPPAPPAGLTAWCWAAEKSSSRPLLTRAECLPGKILLRLELTREGPGPPGEGTSWGEKGGCSGDPSPFPHIFSFQSWLPSPNPKSLSHPIAPHPTVITSVPQSGPVLGTPGGSAPWEYPSPPGALQAWSSAQSGCGFKAPRDASPPQSLPNSLSLTAGLEGMGSSKLEAGLGASQYQPPSPARAQLGCSVSSATAAPGPAGSAQSADVLRVTRETRNPDWSKSSTEGQAGSPQTRAAEQPGPGGWGRAWLHHGGCTPEVRVIWAGASPP